MPLILLVSDIQDTWDTICQQLFLSFSKGYSLLEFGLASVSCRFSEADLIPLTSGSKFLVAFSIFSPNALISSPSEGRYCTIEECDLVATRKIKKLLNYSLNILNIFPHALTENIT